LAAWRRAEAASLRIAAGFTLLEVLVAMVIIGVVLLAALRGAMALTTSTDQARLRLLAILSAENRLLELRLANGVLAPGTSSFSCDQGGKPLVCLQSIQPTPNPFFRRVEVRVLHGDPDGEREYALLMSVMPTNGK
jgi:general secretion pathway protein I